MKKNKNLVLILLSIFLGVIVYVPAVSANKLVFTESYLENFEVEKFELNLKNIKSNSDLLFKLDKLFVNSKKPVLTSGYFIAEMKDKPTSSNQIDFIVYNFNTFQKRCKYAAFSLVNIFENYVLPNAAIKGEKFNVYIIE